MCNGSTTDSDSVCLGSNLIEQLGSEMDGKAVVGKVDIDEQPELRDQYGIMSIPTLIVFKDGKEVSRVLGVQPKQALVQMMLDPKTAAKVLDTTERIVQKDHLTTLMITHNMRDAIVHGNRLIMMHEGKIALGSSSPKSRIFSSS